MPGSRFTQYCTVACVLLAAASAALARHADRIFYYRFDSDLSRLDVSGGFPGVSESHAIDGTFSLHYAAVHDGPSLYEIYFQDVDAKLAGDGIFGGRSLDKVLNLTGLQGRFVNDNQIAFVGVESQNSAMLLVATMQGPTPILAGANVQQCCDFFGFRIEAVAELLPYISTGIAGDMDNNGVVDAFDVDEFEAALATAFDAVSLPPETYLHLSEAGDINGDGAFDTFDVGPFEQLLAQQPVPEPAMLTLFGAAGLALIGARGARRRRRA